MTKNQKRLVTYFTSMTYKIIDPRCIIRKTNPAFLLSEIYESQGKYKAEIFIEGRRTHGTVSHIIKYLSDTQSVTNSANNGQANASSALHGFAFQPFNPLLAHLSRHDFSGTSFPPRRDGVRPSLHPQWVATIPGECLFRARFSLQHDCL